MSTKSASWAFLPFGTLLLASTAALPQSLVLNSLGVGPARVPQYVVDICGKRAGAEEKKQCLIDMGFPVTVGSGPMTATPQLEAEHCVTKNVNVEGRAEGDGWYATAWSPIETSETATESNLAVPDGVLQYQSRARFWVRVAPHGQEEPASSIQLKSRFEMYPRDMEKVLRSAMLEKAPKSEGCNQRVRIAWSYGVSKDRLKGALATHVERWACTSTNVPCSTGTKLQCVLGVCTDVPQFGTCRASATTILGSYDATATVFVVPSIKQGNLLLNLDSEFQKGKLPDTLEALGDFEQFWNTITFNTQFFRSSNYANTIEKINSAAVSLAAVQGTNIFQQKILVPGLETFKLNLGSPAFFEVDDRSGRHVGLKIDASGELPLSSACKLIDGLNEYLHIKVNRR